MRSALGICCVVLAAAALAACGDSGPSTEEEVREAAVKAIESRDPKAFCRTLVSAHYIDLVYAGDVQECIDSDESVLDDPGEARASAVVVDPKDETHAEVELTMRGGELDDTAGHVEMVEGEDGWKLDDVADDYLRSTFLAEIETVNQGVVAIPSMKVCFKRQVRTLDAAKLRN